MLNDISSTFLMKAGRMEFCELDLLTVTFV